MAEFKARLSAPSAADKNYIHYYMGGYNTCIIIEGKTGSVIPNCVGYAQGRLLEIMGANKVNWKLPACNACDWFAMAKKNGLPTGSTPKLGAVICWGGAGLGHIAVVEEIKSNGDLVISYSRYGHERFLTKTITKASGYMYHEKLSLQGFIYCGIEFQTPSKTIGEGDRVAFTGSKHYTSSTGSTSKPASKGNAKVTKVAEGAKHPYHIIGEGSCSAYGWVNKTDVCKI